MIKLILNNIFCLLSLIESILWDNYKHGGKISHKFIWNYFLRNPIHSWQHGLKHNYSVVFPQIPIFRQSTWALFE